MKFEISDAIRKNPSRIALLDQLGKYSKSGSQNDMQVAGCGTYKSQKSVDASKFEAGA
jgi:hypothetical protein